MVTVGLLVRLEAKPGKEAELERFLEAGLSLVSRNQRQSPGLLSAWDHRPSVFSMSS